MCTDAAVFAKPLAGEDASSVPITSNIYLDLSMGSREKGLQRLNQQKKVGKNKAHLMVTAKLEPQL